ncbi:MAG: hypothetical protein ACM3XZ_05525 [Betaproteobacteria bacterium]
MTVDIALACAFALGSIPVFWLYLLFMGSMMPLGMLVFGPISDVVKSSLKLASPIRLTGTSPQTSHTEAAAPVLVMHRLGYGTGIARIKTH